MADYKIKIYDKVNRKTIIEDIRSGRREIHDVIDVMSRTLSAGQMIIGVEELLPTTRSIKQSQYYIKRKSKAKK